MMSNQPQLDPEALEAAAKELFLEDENTAYVKYPEWDSPENVGKPVYIENARAAVSAYLAAALPEVTTVEELDVLPVESVIRSVRTGRVRERFRKGWLPAGGTAYRPSAGVDLPARVLYRPEANDA